MKFRAGNHLRVKHYSSDSFQTVIIQSASDTILTIRQDKQDTVIDFFAEDPLVILFAYDKELYVGDAYVKSVDYRLGLATFKVLHINLVENRRGKNRYYTSLYARIVTEAGEEYPSYICNLSETGAQFRTLQQYETGESILVQVRLEQDSVTMHMKILWRKDLENICEYGAVFMEEDAMHHKLLQYVIAEEERELRGERLFSGSGIPLVKGG